MKTNQLLLVFLMSITMSYAQLDTLYVNNTHVLPLIFPEPISRAVTGNFNYTLGYNRGTPERVGLLQGNQGDDSNLLVVTEDGLAYSYYLIYRKQLEESHRFVAINEAIGNVLPKKRLEEMAQKEKGKGRSPGFPLSDSLQYRKASHYFLEQNTTVLKAKRRDGMVLRLCDVAYFGRETYIVLEIENKSNIDFEVDFVELFKVHGNPRKKSSYQKLSLEPIYSYKKPSIVKVGHVERFVFVQPKFTLSGKESLWVELQEKRGSRKLVLKGSRNHGRAWPPVTQSQGNGPRRVLEPKVFISH